MTTRALPNYTGGHVQDCAKLATMTGAGPTVSSWGRVNEHTIPTCAPKPEDREAPLPPPWSDGHDVRDIKKPQGLTTPLCLPIVLKNQGVKESRPRRKLAMLDLAMMADSQTTGTDTVTLTGTEFQLLVHAMKKADRTVPFFRFEGYLERIPTTFMVDSGANENYLGPDLAKMAKIRPVPIEAPYEVSTATGEGIPITSKCRPRVQIGQFVKRMQFKVAPIDPGVCILGMSFLDSVNPLIRWKERRMRLPVRKTEGRNYQWMTSLTLIPRALAGLTNNEEAGDETSGVVNDGEDDDGDEDDV